MGVPARLAAGLVLGAIALGQAPAIARAASADRTLPGMYTVGATAGQPLPLVASAIDVHVDGPFAEATVVQRYRNPFDRPIEAVYVFPLPDDAAVSSMVIRTGQRTLVAHIEDRAAARARYEAAVGAGVSGALLEQERPDVFTQAVTAIAPGAEIAVELRWDAGVVRRGGVWELVVPLVVGPRQVPGTATGALTKGSGWSADTDRAPDASRVTPDAGGAVPSTLRVHLDAIGPVASVEVPSHDAEVELHGASAEVVIRDARADRDAVIHWRTKGDALAAVTDADGFVAVVVPAPAAAAPSARDWVIVADTSKRMAGTGLTLVRGAVRALLARVGPHDRVALVDGGGVHVVALGGAAAIARARTWIDAAASAGTGDLAAALTSARALARGARRPAIVLVGDGLVADDREVIAAAAGGPPIVAIGVGAAPARGLLDRLAARGGVARYAGAGDDVDGLVAAVIAALDPGAPIAIDWGGMATDVEPATMPALAPGDAITVIAKVDRARAVHVAVAARALDLPATWVTAARQADAIAPGSVIARRWAHAKIEAMVAADLATTAGAGDHGARADQIRALGLRYGLVTPETALVAIGTEVVAQGGVSTSVAVPVALPAGMKWQAVFGATDARDATYHAGKSPPQDDDKAGGAVSPEPGPVSTTDTGATGGAHREADGDVNQGARVATASPPLAAERGEEVMVTGAGTLSVGARRWRLALALGAGELIEPSRAALGVVSLRLDRGIGADTALGLDATVIAAPHADDRVAVALMAALVRGGLWADRLQLEVGLGPEVASSPGLGYVIAARFGGRVGLVLRWDGAILFGADGAFGRGSATAGVELGF